MQRHCDNAQTVAEWLSTNKHVAWVSYPVGRARGTWRCAPCRRRRPCPASRAARCARSRISRAALLVNVIATMCAGSAPRSIEVRDLGGDHARLAAAGAGEHEQRAVAVAHGLALRGVERKGHRRARCARIARNSNSGAISHRALDGALRDRRHPGLPRRVLRAARPHRLLAARDRLWLVGDLVNRGPGFARRAARRDGAGRRRDGGARQSRLPSADGRRRASQAASRRHARRHPRSARSRRAPRLALRAAAGRARRRARDGARRAAAVVDRRRRRSRCRAKSRRCSRATTRTSSSACSTATSRAMARRPRRATTGCASIVNACTRLRFCTADDTMEFNEKRGPASTPEGFAPWFDASRRGARRRRPSSAATGRRSSSCSTPNVLMLDSGCVWGGALTAVRLAGPARVSRCRRASPVQPKPFG